MPKAMVAAEIGFGREAELPRHDERARRRLLFGVAAEKKAERRRLARLWRQEFGDPAEKQGTALEILVAEGDRRGRRRTGAKHTPDGGGRAEPLQ